MIAATGSLALALISSLVLGSDGCDDAWFGGCPDKKCFDGYKELISIADAAERAQRLKAWRAKCKQESTTNDAPKRGSSTATGDKAASGDKGVTGDKEKNEPLSGHTRTPPPPPSPGGWMWGSPADIVGCIVVSGEERSRRLRHFVCHAQPPGFCPSDMRSQCRLLSEVPLASLSPRSQDSLRYSDVPVIDNLKCRPFLNCANSFDSGRALIAWAANDKTIRVLRSPDRVNEVPIRPDLLQYEHDLHGSSKPTVPTARDRLAYLLREVLGNDPEARLLQGISDDGPSGKPLCAVFKVSNEDNLYCFPDSGLVSYKPLRMNWSDPKAEEQYVQSIRMSGPNPALGRVLDDVTNSRPQVLLARAEGLFGTSGPNAFVWKHDSRESVPDRTNVKLSQLINIESRALRIDLIQKVIADPALLLLETDDKQGACVAVRNDITCFIVDKDSWIPLAADLPNRADLTAWIRADSDFGQNGVLNRFLRYSIGHRTYLHRTFGKPADNGMVLGISDRQEVSWSAGCESSLTLFAVNGPRKQATRFVVLDAHPECSKALHEAEQMYQESLASFILEEQPTEIESVQFGAGRMAIAYLRSGEAQLRLWLAPEQALPSVSLESLERCAGLPLGPDKQSPKIVTILRGILTGEWRKDWKANPLGLVLRAQQGCH